MAAILLDTSVVIDLLRGRRGAVARMRDLRKAGDSPHVCAISLEEVVRGMRASEGERTHKLFAGLRIVPVGESEGWRAGKWRREHAESGRTLSQADCLIAAAAVAVGGRLATGNQKDFPMPELTVEHWPVGE